MGWHRHVSVDGGGVEVFKHACLISNKHIVDIGELRVHALEWPPRCSQLLNRFFEIATSKSLLKCCCLCSYLDSTNSLPVSMPSPFFSFKNNQSITWATYLEATGCPPHPSVIDAQRGWAYGSKSNLSSRHSVASSRDRLSVSECGAEPMG